MWYICLSLSILLIVVTCIYLAFAKAKRQRTISVINILLCSVFVSNTLVFLPLYYDMFVDSAALPQFLKSILVSMHHTIRLFIVDSDFQIIKDAVPNTNTIFYNVYTCYTAILFLLSPLLTFGFIFSFFRNMAAHRKYLAKYNSDVYVFSEFNDESVALATSIKEQFNKCAIVFTNVCEEKSDYTELHERAKLIEPIFFEKDILALHLDAHSKNKDINLMIIGTNEEGNLKNALGLINKYNTRPNTQLYVLSNEIEGELQLNAAQVGEIKVRRISNIRTTIFSILQNKGHLLFEEAIDDSTIGQKRISAVVVGMGKLGKEMTKSLAWFCQMEGYRIEIDSFDMDPQADEHFAALCPELMDEKINNKFEDVGESQYRINVHSGVDVDTIKFYNDIKSLTNTTYVFVDLGSDEKNIRTSIKLRMLFEQIGITPRIHAIVENSARKKALKDIKNYSGQPYNIEYEGSTDEIYSYGNIINSDLEHEALSRHLCWGEEAEFWKYEYNYRSSMASALHKRMKKICKIPGIEKKPSERLEEEKQTLRLMEHRRWNTYMRSEGYVFSETRNNMAKTHHCLVTFDLLSQKDKEKDDD